MKAPKRWDDWRMREEQCDCDDQSYYRVFMGFGRAMPAWRCNRCGKEDRSMKDEPVTPGVLHVEACAA